MCREAALSSMDAGWGLEVGELLLVSPTWSMTKNKTGATFNFYCFAVKLLTIAQNCYSLEL